MFSVVNLEVIWVAAIWWLTKCIYCIVYIAGYLHPVCRFHEELRPFFILLAYLWTVVNVLRMYYFCFTSQSSFDKLPVERFPDFSRWHQVWFFWLCRCWNIALVNMRDCECCRSVLLLLFYYLKWRPPCIGDTCTRKYIRVCKQVILLGSGSYFSCGYLLRLILGGVDAPLARASWKWNKCFHFVSSDLVNVDYNV